VGHETNEDYGLQHNGIMVCDRMRDARTFVFIENHTRHVTRCHNVQIFAAGVRMEVGVRCRGTHAVALGDLNEVG
jgi:hypothetical protein